MWYSLFVRLTMLALTIGVVFWIGWTVPQSRSFNAEHVIEVQPGGDIRDGLAVPPAVTPADTKTVIGPSTEKMRSLRQPVTEQLDLNTATEQDLEALPGIGPVLAERIVEYRQLRGGFRDVTQLRDVKGIGKKKFDRIRTIVRVTPVSMHQRGDRKAA
jgi:competence protein ComEA